MQPFGQMPQMPQMMPQMQMQPGRMQPMPGPLMPGQPMPGQPMMQQQMMPPQPQQLQQQQQPLLHQVAPVQQQTPLPQAAPTQAKKGKSPPANDQVSQEAAQAQAEADAKRLVYVGNLPFKIKWQDLKEHMGQAGTVEFARVLTDDGTDWGRSRGSGYVRYATEEEAQQAVAQLKESVLGERTLTVDAWTGSTGGQGKGKGKGKGKGWQYAMMMKGWGKGWGKQQQVQGDPAQLVYVGNLPYQATWKELKDHMSPAGTVEFCKILTEDGTNWGRSRGVGCVRYSSEAEAQQAINTLNKTDLNGREINVDNWTKGTPKEAKDEEVEEAQEEGEPAAAAA